MDGPGPGSVIIVGADKRVTIQNLVLGFCRAYYRFLAEQDKETSSGDFQGPARAYMAIFEALNWADAVDEFLSHGPEQGGGHPGWLESLPTEQRNVAKGIQHARNVVHHQWWGAISTMIVRKEDGQEDTWIWGDLPGNNRNRDGQRVYDAALRGKPIAETLGLLRDAFWSVRRWEISADDLDQPAYLLPANAPHD